MMRGELATDLRRTKHGLHLVKEEFNISASVIADDYFVACVEAVDDAVIAQLHLDVL